MKIFENVVVTPVAQSGANKFSGGVFSADGHFVDECRHLRGVNGNVHTSENIDVEKLLISYTAPVGLYGGFAFNHFGHFLAETLGRLWAAAEPQYSDMPIFVHPIWGRVVLGDREGYVATVFDLLGLDPSRVRFITDPIRIARLYVPEQLYGFHNFEHVSEKMIGFLSKAQASIEEKAKEFPKGDERLYVSRSQWLPEKGLIAGEAEFETFLASQGWTIYCPEKAPFIEQLIAYSNAKQIIFSEGSAYHSMILLPNSRADVAIVFRRKPGWNQERIEAQFHGFGKKLLSVQHVRRQICAGMPNWSGVSIVDFEAVSKDLVAAGFISESFAKWYEREEELCARDLARFIESVASDRRFLNFVEKSRNYPVPQQKNEPASVGATAKWLIAEMG